MSSLAESDDRLTTWRPLSVGAEVRVTSRCKAYTGYRGTITEVLEQRIDGLSRYGVRLYNSVECVTDFRRFELTVVKPPKKKRAA